MSIGYVICMRILTHLLFFPFGFLDALTVRPYQHQAAFFSQFALISAFLGSQDPHEWRDLAIRCLHTGSRKQALVCYNNGMPFHEIKVFN